MSLEDAARKKRTTNLALEMSICAEWLHCFHWQFVDQPVIEKLKWYAYAEAKSDYYEKENKKREMEQRARNAEAKAKAASSKHRYR